MAVMIHSKYGYNSPELVKAYARLDKGCKDMRRRTKQRELLENKTQPVYQPLQGNGFNLENNS